MSKTLIICFDGTWLSKKDFRPSNISKLHNLASRKGQMVLYVPGVGAGKDMDALGKLLGGAFGLGAHGRRNKAYKWLCRYWEPGDKLVLLGFSRGAAIARMLAYYLSEEGIKGHKVSVDFLGCFDTVAAFGIPINIGPFKFQRINLFTNLEVGRNVKHAVHLVALDENREAFLPSLMNLRRGIEEVWYIGTHSDVGGGEPSSGLSDITLQYMLKRASTAGVKFDVTSDIKPDCNGTIHAHDVNLKPQVRAVEVLVDDKPSDVLPRIHQTVALRLPPYTPAADVNLSKVMWAT